MSRHVQPDLFGESRPELPGVEKPPVVYRADPDKVRAELLGVLAELRAAQSFPWYTRRTVRWRTVLPQMTNWPPDEEAAQLRFEFETDRDVGRDYCHQERCEDRLIQSDAEPGDQRYFGDLARRQPVHPELRRARSGTTVTPFRRLRPSADSAKRPSPTRAGTLPSTVCHRDPKKARTSASTVKLH